MASDGRAGGGVNDDAFVYAGQPLEEIPRDVRFVRVDPSVRKIEDEALMKCKKLENPELCQGLVDIGEHAFWLCGNLQHVTIPPTVRRIDRGAFAGCVSLTSLRLPDGVETIAEGALHCCMGLTNFRVPPLINAIEGYLSYHCQALFSIELPENVAEIERFAFHWCRSLRNIAIPANAVIDKGSTAFYHCSDLHQLFWSDEHITDELADDLIIDALKHRFDGLPIHKMIYYRAYQPVTLDQLNELGGYNWKLTG